MPRAECGKEGTLKSKVARIFGSLSEKDSIRGEIKPTRATNFLSSMREDEKRASEEKRKQNAARGNDEGIDIGNGGGYIFQNIGYLRGKPVVCILMDRPVYGAQFISKSKVMAAGLRPVVRFPPPPSVFDHPRPHRQVPAATTLKFQTNTKMAGSDPDMYCPIFRRFSRNKRNGKRNIHSVLFAYARSGKTMIYCIIGEFFIYRYNNFNKYDINTVRKIKFLRTTIFYIANKDSDCIINKKKLNFK